MQFTEHNSFAEREAFLWRAEFLNKTFTVFYNKKKVPGQYSDGTTEVLSKANAELLAKGGKEPFKVIGPVVTCNTIEINAENKEAAVVCARLFIGAVDSEGELTVVETSSLEKLSDKI